jgi:hypothetical protein
MPDGNSDVYVLKNSALAIYCSSTLEICPANDQLTAHKTEALIKI